jgi:hypothetical protein
VVLEQGDHEVDLALVDDLLRLRLLAARSGWTFELRAPSPELVELLWLVGVADVLGQSCR